MNIKNLKPNKSPGQDKFTNERVKLRGEKLVRTLTQLFNKILEGGFVPDMWKYSNVIILYEKRKSTQSREL